MKILKFFFCFIKTTSKLSEEHLISQHHRVVVKQSLHDAVDIPNMKVFLFLLLGLLFATCIEGDTYLRGHEEEADINLLHSHVFKERIARLDNRGDISKQSVISPDYTHEVIFVIKQKNIVELTRILHDVSNPSSPNYGHHLTKKEVSAMTSNPTSRDAVIAYLESSGAKVTAVSLDSEYVTASAPVRLWNDLFHTEFFLFHQTEMNNNKSKRLIRAEKYWIPRTLESHVESVFNTIQMPTKLFGGPVIAQSSIESAKSHDKHYPQVAEVQRRNHRHSAVAFPFPGYVWPAILTDTYNIGDARGTSLSTQAIFATIEQYYSPADLLMFQENVGPLAIIIIF
jgi:subtilase family serine protease